MREGVELFYPQRLAASDFETSECFDCEEAFGNGLFQSSFLMLSAVAILLTTCHADLVPITASQGVDHWCKRPDNSALSLKSWKKDTVPVNADGRRSRCRVYGDPPESPRLFRTNRSEVACREWDYESGDDGASVASAWDAVCQRRVLVLFGTMAMQQAGSLFFLLAGGLMLDAYGRDRVRLGAAVITTVCTVLGCTFIRYRALYAIAQCVLSGSAAVNAAATLLVSFEVLIDRHKPKHVIFASTPSIALAELWFLVVRNMRVGWEVKHAAFLSPTFLLVITAAFMGRPESPRWLIAKGRIKEAEAVILGAARMNGFVPGPGAANLLERIENVRRCGNRDSSASSDSDPRRHSPIDASASIRRRLLVMFAVHFSLAFAVHVNIASQVARGDDRDTWWLPSVLVSAASVLGNAVVHAAVTCVSLDRVLVAASVVAGGIHCVASVFCNFETAADRGLLAFSSGVANVAIVVGACRLMEGVPTAVRGAFLCWSLAGGRVGALLGCLTPLLSQNARGHASFALSAFFLMASSFLAVLSRPSSQREVEREDNHETSFPRSASSLRGSRPPSCRPPYRDSVGSKTS
nr:solute carrier family 22 member 7-like [Dermacentor andersoni]